MFANRKIHIPSFAATGKHIFLCLILLSNLLVMASNSFGQFKAMEDKEQKTLLASESFYPGTPATELQQNLSAYEIVDSSISIYDNYISKHSFLSSIKKTEAAVVPFFDVKSATDSLLSPQQIKRRTRIMAITQVSIYAGLMAGLYKTWYSKYPQSSFHSFNDWSEWKGMDKIGHTYSAYAQSKAAMELWRWTGIDRKKRIWYGGLAGVAYQTVIETLDGFSAEWGWSWGDISANIAGSALVIGQELAWDEQRVQLKWSFHRKKYNDPALTARSDELFGATTAERILKDYNGQTYWVSTTLKPFFPTSKMPDWLQVSIGTGAEGLFGGRENIARDKDGTVTFYRPEIKRYRQWYLAPDINLSKIKTNKKGIRIALDILNILKFPTPSLEYSNGGLKMNWFHF